MSKYQSKKCCPFLPLRQDPPRPAFLVGLSTQQSRPTTMRWFDQAASCQSRSDQAASILHTSKAFPAAAQAVSPGTTSFQHQHDEAVWKLDS